MPGQPPNPPVGPQQVNALVPPGAQNPQGGNNPVGFIGRFFGPAVRPPNPPLNRQAAQNPNNNNQGQPGGPGIFINYQVQYQFPRQPNERNGQTLYPPQQPIPPYPGFTGPGGVWQPWPGAANGAQAAEAGNPGSMQADTPSNTSLPEVRESFLDNSASTTPSVASGSSSLDNQTTSESPRKAAARAALSRLGGVKPPGNSSQQASFTSTPAEAYSSSPLNSRPSMPSDIPRRNVHLPRLIPLYDYQSQGANPRASTLLDSSTQQILPTPSLQPNSHPTSPSPFSRSELSVSPSPFTSQSSSTNTFPSQLPASLTDDQLATLDRLTREGIDERLRILEGVSGTIYRCIDDLLRLRSALPQADLPPSFGRSTPPSSSDPQTSHTEDEDASTSHNKGKKPERFVQVVNDTQVSESSGEDL